MTLSKRSIVLVVLVVVALAGTLLAIFFRPTEQFGFLEGLEPSGKVESTDKYYVFRGAYDSFIAKATAELSSKGYSLEDSRAFPGTPDESRMRLFTEPNGSFATVRIVENAEVWTPSKGSITVEILAGD